MANTYRGEVTLTFAGRCYTLRPTFHILCTLESRLGLTLPELLHRIQQKGLLTSEILLILSVATKHDGSTPFSMETALDLAMDDPSLQRIIPDVARFLLGSLHGQPALNMPQLLRNSHKTLGMEPATFWQMTMAELTCLFSQNQAVEKPQNELASLMATFPDNTLVA